MTATMAPSAIERGQHRAQTRGLRDNAGIDNREHVEAVADFGAAARRLRASVRGGSDVSAADGVIRRPISPAARLAADADRRQAELAAKASEAIARADADAGQAAHPAGTGRRFRLRSVR